MRRAMAVASGMLALPEMSFGSGLAGMLWLPQGGLDDRIVTLTPLSMGVGVWQSYAKGRGAAKMAHIDYYFSTLSPSAYHGGHAAGGECCAKNTAPTDHLQAARHHGAVLRVRAVFNRWPSGTPNRQAYRAQDMARQAKRLGHADQRQAGLLAAQSLRPPPMRSLRHRRAGGAVIWGQLDPFGAARALGSKRP